MQHNAHTHSLPLAYTLTRIYIPTHTHTYIRTRIYDAHSNPIQDSTRCVLIMFGPSKLGNKSSLGSSVPRSLDGELQVRLQAPPYARDPIEGGPLPDSRPSIRRSGKGIRHEASEKSTRRLPKALHSIPVHSKRQLACRMAAIAFPLLFYFVLFYLVFTKLETKNGNGGIPTNYRK